MSNALPNNEFQKTNTFRPDGGVFKLVPAPHPATNKFKPDGMREVALAASAQPTPTEFGHLGFPPKAVPVPAPTAAMPPTPPTPPAVIPMPSPSRDDDAKVMARIQRLFEIEKRANELEQENDLLLKIVNRLKAENAALKIK